MGGNGKHRWRFPSTIPIQAQRIPQMSSYVPFLGHQYLTLLSSLRVRPSSASPSNSAASWASPPNSKTGHDPISPF
ncbi:hypothetical protein COP1_012639 [Malus domestica]